jgi:hypothetical protein
LERSKVAPDLEPSQNTIPLKDEGSAQTVTTAELKISEDVDSATRLWKTRNLKIDAGTTAIAPGYDAGLLQLRQEAACSFLPVLEHPACEFELVWTKWSIFRNG